MVKDLHDYVSPKPYIHLIYIHGDGNFTSDFEILWIQKNDAGAQLKTWLW